MDGDNLLKSRCEPEEMAMASRKEKMQRIGINTIQGVTTMYRLPHTGWFGPSQLVSWRYQRSIRWTFWQNRWLKSSERNTSPIHRADGIASTMPSAARKNGVQYTFWGLTGYAPPDHMEKAFT